MLYVMEILGTGVSCSGPAVKLPLPVILSIAAVNPLILQTRTLVCLALEALYCDAAICCDASATCHIFGCSGYLNDTVNKGIGVS